MGSGNFMNDLYCRLKKYIILIRAYSIIDVILLLLLARMLAIGSALFSWRDVVIGVGVIFLWGVLTLSLEAKHNHAYRETICYSVPIIFLVAASSIAYLFNPQALLFIFFVSLFTYFYIKKETNEFWGMTSSFWRGMCQVAIFFTCWSLYALIGLISLREIGVAIIVLCFHLSRNLIADVRDAEFDRLTLVVFWGRRVSYLIALTCFIVGGTVLFLLFPTIFVIFPVIVISLLLVVYDDGFMLHRLAIMVTSFTFVAIILFLKSANLFYPNLLFLAIVSNFLFYEKVARPSNPIPRVPSYSRFLLRLPTHVTNFCQSAAHDDIV